MNKVNVIFASYKYQKGIALLPIAIIITVIAAVSLLLSYESSMNVNTTVAELEGKQADLVAEAGMAHAKWQLTQNTSCLGYTNVPATGLSGHSYSVSITPSDGSPVTITSSGVSNKGITRSLTSADVKVYQPSFTKEYLIGSTGKDSFIEGEEGHHDHNKGNDKDLRINSKPDKIDRALLQFDLSQLSTSAKITSAILELYLNDSKGNDDTIYIHRITDNWVEDEVTWDIKRSGFLGNWNPAGGEFVSTVAGSFVADTIGWKSADITQLVQDWVKVPSINQGMILQATPASGNNEKKFTSSDDNDSSLHPKLTITYACECGQVCLNPDMSKLLFVVPNPGDLDTEDTERLELIESWGYTVTLIDDSDSQSDFDSALNENDVVYITESVSSGNVSDKLRNATIGVVNEERAIVDDFGLASNYFSVDTTNIEIVNNSHYITSVFPLGSLIITTTTKEFVNLNGIISTGLDVLADSSFNLPFLSIVDVGDTLYDSGNAAGRRVQLPWSENGFDFSSLTDEAKTIMRRSIEWAAGANNEVNNSGLIAHWMLDESSGLIAKDSINGFDGELQNDPEWNTSGRIDGALEFDETNAQVVVPHNDALSPDNALTISAWIYNDASFLIDAYRIISKESFGANDNYFLSMSADALVLGIGGEFFMPSTTFSSEQWYHVAATFDDNTNEVRIYIDGVEVLNESTTASLTPNTDDVFIGSNWQEFKWWEGLIDDVRLYDYALTSAEVADIFSSAPTEDNGDSGGEALKSPGVCSGNYLDQFNTDESYAGNDGSLNWSNNWDEINENGNPASGDEQVRSDSGQNYVLRVRDNDGGGEGVQREADLSSYTSATLNFNYRRDSLDNDNDYVKIDISSNGGSSWSELGRIEGPATDGSYQSFSQNITAYIATNTRIRFVTSSTNGSTDTVYFDNVEIAVSGCVE